MIFLYVLHDENTSNFTSKQSVTEIFASFQATSSDVQAWNAFLIKNEKNKQKLISLKCHICNNN